MPEYEISLAEWSLHRSLESGRIERMDFPRVAREEFGIGAVELVNTLMDGYDVGSVRELARRANDAGVKVHLIMCDDEGDLSAESAAERERAARNHFKWLDAAASLGCRAVRVNTGGEDAPQSHVELIRRCAESCALVVEYAAKLGLDVLVENHWGFSGDVDSLVELVRRVDHPRFGVLPDFGNFEPRVDRYAAVERMMPHARAVSVKCFDFDDHTGEETTMDLARMLDIARRAGYRGYLGIEYEGERLEEFEGVRRARRFLDAWIERPGPGAVADA
jgi:sugar phosphate isomerase/epimerase